MTFSGSQSLPPRRELVEVSARLKAELLGMIFGVRAVGAADRTAIISSIPPGHNILGVGFGAKETNGAGLDDLALRVYVRAKLSRSELSRSALVPDEVDGVPTDVLAVGDVVAASRPTPCGVSIGHHKTTAGTLGCLVRRTEAGDGDRFVLSNNHVLADTNDASIGDAILEPGQTDGGDPRNPIAELTDFEPIDFGAGPNHMDAAIARLHDSADVTPDIAHIGAITGGPRPADLYESVRKHGRTTQHTIGVVMDLSADIRVRYGTKFAQFDGQVAVTGVGGSFSNGGDSGALVVDGVTRAPVGLLFAGGGTTTFVNPLGPILARFGAAVVT